MILFALPLMATAILQQLFNTADTIVVGRFSGMASLAAVGSCGALVSLIIALLNGFSTAVGVSVAHAIGAKHEEKIHRVVHTAVPAGFLGGVLIGVISFVFAEDFLRLMGTDESCIAEAAVYLRALCFGFSGQLTYNYCAAMVRAEGDATRPMVFLTIAGVCNVILNLVFVLGFHMGAVGVGIATSVSHWISCLLVVHHLMTKSPRCRLYLRQMRIRLDILREMVVMGIPAGLQSSMFSISNVLIQSSVNSFGATVIAGNTAAANLDNYIYFTMYAVADTSLTFVGQNVGANNYARVKKVVRNAVCIVGVTGISVGLILYLFSDPLLHLYIPSDEEAMKAAMLRHTLICFTYVLCGFMDTLCACTRGFGWSVRPMVASLIGSCLLRVVWIFTVFAWARENYFEQSLSILYYCYPVTWIITASAHAVFCLTALGQMKTGRLRSIAAPPRTETKLEEKEEKSTV